MHIISNLDIQTKIKRLDREWRDIQLFKILNGINVSGIEDVRMIQQGLIDGKLKHRIFPYSLLGRHNRTAMHHKTMSAVPPEFFILSSHVAYTTSNLP